MMENIFYCINILLPRYKCVTLPGLGAFILNLEERNLDAETLIAPSSYKVSFNRELQHDDGVLSSYIQLVKGVSYDVASREVAFFVKELKKELLYEGKVTCGLLGSLIQENGQVLFVQNREYICPLYYGLTPVALETLSSIQKTAVKTTRKVVFKRRLVAVSTAAAVALLLLLPSNVITDANFKGTQQAGYIKSLIETPKTVQESSELPMIEELNAESLHVSSEIVEPAVKKTGRTYYIVLGGATSKSALDKVIEIFETDGLTNLQVVESDDRYRIYNQSFEDKAEAEQTLIQFRKDNPKYETAWLFSKRN